MKFTLINSLKTIITEQYNTAEFTFKSMKPWKRKGNNPTWFVYFNNLDLVDGQYVKGDNSLIYLIGNGEEFSVDPRYFDYYPNTKTGRVLLNVLKKDYPKIIDMLFSGDVERTPKSIRKDL